jgi:hydroxymethylglutaryl-CoA synthase
MTERAIAGIGAYAPRYRLSSAAVTEAWGQFHGAGISTTAVPAADEDTLTMAAEAASRALGAAGADPDDITGLTIGTTTPPTEEEAMAPRLASVLGLPESVRTRQVTGSTRAGVDAIVAGLGDGVGAGADGASPVLAVATDAPRGAPGDAIEHAVGAGAVALVLAPDAPGSIRGLAEHNSPYPGTRFRPAGSTETTGLGVTGYEREAFVETVVAAADALDADPAGADAIALQSPNGKLPYRAAGALGVDTGAINRGTVVSDLGDLGAASAPFGLAAALDDGARRVLLVGYGSGGGATALAVTDGGIPVRLVADGDEPLSYGEYLRMRGEITSGEPEGGGAYVSVPSWHRTIPQRHRLLAGRCRECDAIAFPPEGACRDCGTLGEYEDAELPGTGTVEAVTVIGQGGAPPEFVEQQARSGAYVSAIVALDGPDDSRPNGSSNGSHNDGSGEQANETASIPAQVVGVDPGTVGVGDRVTATIRRIYTQEGVTRYGFKMQPVGHSDYCDCVRDHVA